MATSRDILEHVREETFFNGKVTRTLRWVAVERLKTCKYNPESRNAVPQKLLEAAVEACGVLIPLHIWEQEMEVVDGHGRVAVAKEMGLTHMLVWLYQCNKEHRDKVFTMLNLTQRPFNGRHQTRVELLGGPEMGRSAHEGCKILRQFYSPAELNKMDTSPSYVKEILKLSNLLVGIGYANDRKVTFRRAFDYVAHHGLSRIIHEFLRNPTDYELRRLWKHIQADKRWTPNPRGSGK